MASPCLDLAFYNRLYTDPGDKNYYTLTLDFLRHNYLNTPSLTRSRPRVELGLSGSLSYQQNSPLSARPSQRQYDLTADLSYSF